MHIYSRRLYVGVMGALIIVALGIGYTVQSNSAPPTEAAEALEHHDHLDSVRPYRVSLREFFGITYARNSHWVLADNLDTLTVEGLVPQNMQPGDQKAPKWMQLVDRYAGDVWPMAYWNRNTDVGVILNVAGGGDSWVYREYVWKQGDKEWVLVAERVEDNPAAVGLHYSMSVQEDVPEEGDVTLTFEVTDDRGNHLHHIVALVNVPYRDGDYGATGDPVAESPLTVLIPAKIASTLSKTTDVEVLIQNAATGERIREHVPLTIE